MTTTTAILIRKTRFSDTSLILTWLSADLGKIKTIAKGALRPKSKFAGMLDLFFVCDINIAASRSKDLHTLNEAVLLDAREALRRDYSKIALAAYFVELIELVTELDHAAPELHDLLTRALDYLTSAGASVRAMEHFESELVRVTGIQNPNASSIMTIGRTYHRIPASRTGLLKTLAQR